ncbi:hypothetical protein BHM03_00059945 [Ensete ventricosum]|nr:hypothetical protein BHM03_00059945 [Ensete ventricosum]
MFSSSWCSLCVCSAVRYNPTPRRTVISPKIPAAANSPGLITWQPGFGFLHWLMWPDSTPMPMISSTAAMAKQILRSSELHRANQSSFRAQERTKKLMLSSLPESDMTYEAGEVTMS